MENWVNRVLVLACSLFLALPPGWCCMVAGQTTKAPTTTSTSDTAKAPVNTEKCCRCCRPNSDSNPSPTDKPSAPSKSFCPFSDRHAILPYPSIVEKVHTAGFVAILSPLACLPPATPIEGLVRSTHYSPPHQRHVLKCVWLC
jgi:hypothetical protein